METETEGLSDSTGLNADLAAYLHAADEGCAEVMEPIWWTDSFASASSSPCLEGVAENISALILSYLPLYDIANVSLTSRRMLIACRSDELWRRLLTYRWNVKTENQPFSNYFNAYTNAHNHPHDLWVTHWNIVHPYDGLSPGRCCIAQDTASQSVGKCRKDDVSNDNPLRSHPIHRNWKSLDERIEKGSIGSAATSSQAMALATGCTRQRCVEPPEYLAPPPQQNSSRAFACASTFHRKLTTQQYNEDMSGFLTDLLFFNLTDPLTEEGQWEQNQVLEEARSMIEQDEESSRDPLHETSHHSWHVCRLSNPDFYRPIVYQVGVQRPECFTVYPSEGYVEPGGSIYLTVGIRPLGSALAYAFEALNVQRDGLDAAWADLYTEEAHLPMAPILIRYQYAATQPTSASPFHDPYRRPATHWGSRRSYRDSADKAEILDYFWKQPVGMHHLKSIRLSVHVHSHYTLSDFLIATCKPWDHAHCYSGPQFISPVLSEIYIDTYEKLNDSWQLDKHKERVLPAYQITPFSSGEPCVQSGQLWGRREEELAQAFIIARSQAHCHLRQRQAVLQNALRCIRIMSAESDLLENTIHSSELLIAVTHAFQSIKCAPWANQEQKLQALKLEVQVDELYQKIPVKPSSQWTPWRLSGVYKHAVCSDSVFGRPFGSEVAEDFCLQDEPAYLDSFRHLAHSPGRYCLGPPEDPNHLGETVSTTSKKYGRVQTGVATDVFMNNPIFALQAGICMIRDPRALQVHGIYDRITYPGTVIRRPKVCRLDRIAPSGRNLLPDVQRRLDLNPGRQNFYLLQDALDTQILHVLEDGAEACPQSSLEAYLCGIPPPGVGLYALSRATAQTDDTLPSQISEVKIDHADRDEGTSEDSDSNHNNERNVEHVPPMGRPNRGSQFLHLLWIIGAQLGLAVIDSPDVPSVFVDRTILIASQWVSISLMAAPLFWTLCARYAQLIPAEPIEYSLENLPFALANKMRFLSEEECGFVAVIVFLIWLALGRWAERHIGRDVFRIMLEHMTPVEDVGKNIGLLQWIRRRVLLWFHRQWDFICPLFIQRRVFAPHWNRRSNTAVFKHVAFWRSRNLDEQRSFARPNPNHSDLVFGDSRDDCCHVGYNNCTTTKVVIGSLVALGSFCSSSPHFWLNLATVFSCSISLGMSVTLHSMERGRSGVNFYSFCSLLKAANLATVVIMAFLIGQLVGSSGGTMFLAEFIVTTISLVLGGAGAVTTSVVESWLCFFCLSLTAFCGFLLGRVALMDGVRQKRGGYSSILLSKAVLLLVLFWGTVFCFTNWDSPVSLMIVTPDFGSHSHMSNHELAANLLQ